MPCTASQDTLGLSSASSTPGATGQVIGPNTLARLSISYVEVERKHVDRHKVPIILRRRKNESPFSSIFHIKLSMHSGV